MRGPQTRGPIDVQAKRRPNVFFTKPLSKYNHVARALPYKEREADCEWVTVFTARGRKLLVPKEQA